MLASLTFSGVSLRVTGGAGAFSGDVSGAGDRELLKDLYEGGLGSGLGVDFFSSDVDLVTPVTGGDVIVEDVDCSILTGDGGSAGLTGLVVSTFCSGTLYCSCCDNGFGGGGLDSLRGAVVVVFETVD